MEKIMKKAGNEIAIRREANLAAAAWTKLEAAAQQQLNGDPTALRRFNWSPMAKGSQLRSGTNTGQAS
jgi:hypothetical protein